MQSSLEKNNKKPNKYPLSSMFLFCILNFCVEADCFEYSFNILIW